MIQSKTDRVERWSIFEIAVTGKKDGNPFTDYEIHGVFSHRCQTVTVGGFYDGDGVYKLRFMPSFEGEYQYEISGSFSDETVSGSFIVTPPSAGNHGPVRVANTYHFAYEDGTPHYSIGTTCYVWHLQSEELQEQTLETLKNSAFNKIRFCVFPKHYDYNLKEPFCYPFEGSKEEGWDFASHTWGLLSVTGKTVYQLRTDNEKWMNNVANIVGTTDTIIFAHGNDIGSWEGYSSDNEVYQYFKSAGYNFYCNVDSSQPYWVQIRSDYVRQGRIDLDGYQLYQASQGMTTVLDGLFTASQVFDSRRPTPVVANGES